MFTLGADPEVFLVDKKGEFACAYGLVPGTKEQPYEVYKGAVQVDGTALEFNIDPASSAEEFVSNLDTVAKQLEGMVSPTYQFLRKVTIQLPKDAKKSLPPEALLIGCNSDVNAYTGEQNEGADPDAPIRSAGGHIHVGGFFSEGANSKTKYEESLRLARLLDKHVGVYSLLWDPDDSRRSIYGAAGSCRLKSFGVEYRTLSNAWLFNRNITRFVWDATELAVEELKKGLDVESQLYREIINAGARTHPFFDDNPTAELVKALL